MTQTNMTLPATTRAGLSTPTSGTSFPARQRASWRGHATRAVAAAGICLLLGTPAASAAGPTGPSTHQAPRLGTPTGGQLVSIGSNQLVLQSLGGRQIITTTTQTGYFQVQATTIKALAVGQRVAISGTPGSSTATSVVIAAQGSQVVAFIQQTNSSTGSGPVGAGTQGPPPGSGTGNAGGTPPNGGPPPAGQAGGTGPGTLGTITTLSGASITVKTVQGTQVRMTLSKTAKVYRLASITRAQLKAGASIAFSLRAQGSRSTAGDVVQTQAGTMAMIALP